MTSIAKGTIILSNINDSLTVIMSPNSCVIPADYDGSNVDLTNAYTVVEAKRGSTPMAFTLTQVSITNNSIQYSVTSIDTYHKKIAITALPTGVVSGAIVFTLTTSDGGTTQINFQFAVVRQATMFDWVLDWENNKTTIGNTYIITPKLFVGHRTPGTGLGTLSGVYIGPDDQNIGTAGIYGLHEGDEIFRLNKDGGVIGGWNIGTAYLFGGHVFIGSTASYIGVSPTALTEAIVTVSGFSHRNTVHDDGGVAMFYNSASDYGLEGYLPKTVNNGTTTYNKTFSLGHVNLIAGWNFDTEAIWIGTKANTAGAGTANNNSITIGTNGLRGYGWYIDTGGNVSFAGGNVAFSSSTNTIAGWNIGTGRLSTAHAALVSVANQGSMYLSAADISNVSNGNLDSTIASSGGIIIKALSSGAELLGYNTSGNMLFKLSAAATSQIGAWEFDNSDLFTGTKATTGFTGASGSMTIGSTGIRGYKWRLESDGSGALANGQVSWTNAGVLTIGGSNGTTLQNDMILTGGIKVKDSNNTVKAGMLADGSGASGIRFFAGNSTPSSAPFRVDETGKMTATDAVVTGQITANSGTIGSWIIQAIADGGALISDNGTTPAVTLDPSGGIRIYNNQISVCVMHMVCSGEAYDRGIGSDIKLDSVGGVIDLKSVGNIAGSTSLTRITPTGIWSDRAGMELPDTDATYVHNGCIIGVGKSKLVASDYKTDHSESCLVGVYGGAENTRSSSPAPAYGGMFDNLKARGLILSRRIVGTSGTTALTAKDVVVVGYLNSGVSATVTLPTEDLYEGRTLIFHHLNDGTMTIATSDGSTIKSATGSTSLTLPVGSTAILTLIKVYVNTNTWVNYENNERSGSFKYIWTAAVISS